MALSKIKENTQKIETENISYKCVYLADKKHPKWPENKNNCWNLNWKKFVRKFELNTPNR